MPEASSSRPSEPSLFRDSAIYAAGLFLNRGLDFALLPLFTNIFTPEEYGAVVLGLTLLWFGKTLCGLGLVPAFIRFAPEHTKGEAWPAFGACTVALVTLSFLLAVALYAWAMPVAKTFGLAGHPDIVPLVAIITLLDALTFMPYALFRAERRPAQFVLHTTLTTVINVGCSIYLVLYEGMGAEGIFWAQVIASGCNAVLVSLRLPLRLPLRLNEKILMPLLRFGLPFVPAGVATVAMDMADRLILEKLMGVAAVGVYSAAYRIGMGMGLVVRAFQYAWAPHILSQSTSAKKAIRRGMMSFCLIAGVMWLAFWLFGDQLVKVELFGHPLLGAAFQADVAIIPPILFAYALSGVSEALMANVYLVGRSGIVPVAWIAAAAVNVVLCFLLIPPLGAIGAAYATVAGYAALAVILWGYSRTTKPL